ncbi:MAG: hypothetical protein ABL940_00745 [Bacteroidia bacterium]
MITNKQDLLPEIFEEFSSSPFFDFESYRVDFNDVAIDFLNFLIISTLVDTDNIEVGPFYDGEDNEGKEKVGSIIAYDIYNSDKMLNLKLNSDFIFEIVLRYYDDNFENGNWRVYSYKLKEEELKNLPGGLVNVMKEVQRENKPKTVHANTLK